MEKRPLVGVSILIVVFLVLGSLSNIVAIQTINNLQQKTNSEGSKTAISTENEGLTLYDMILKFDYCDWEKTLILVVNGFILNGTMGDYGWYVSPVWVTLDFSGSHIFYSVDGGESQEYTGPFVVSTDGHHTVLCTSINEEGEPMEYSVSFKIDCTAPIIILFSMNRAGIFKWKLSAVVDDETSGINRVEFFFNDTFVNTSFAPGPYIVYWKGSMLLLLLKCLLVYHIPFSLFYFYVQPQCIVYDIAGNYVISPKISN